MIKAGDSDLSNRLVKVDLERRLSVLNRLRSRLIAGAPRFSVSIGVVTFLDKEGKEKWSFEETAEILGEFSTEKLWDWKGDQEKIFFTKVNSRKGLAYWSHYDGLYQEAARRENAKDRRVITLRRGLDFYYGGQHMGLEIKTLYYKIFRVIFDHNVNGYISYEEVGEYLVKDYKLEEFRNLKNEGLRKKVSDNVIAKGQGLWRAARVNGKRMKNSMPDGTPILKVRRGKGIDFYNPPA